MGRDPQIEPTERELLRTAVDGLDSDASAKVDVALRRALDEHDEKAAQAAHEDAVSAWNKRYDELGDG